MPPHGPGLTGGAHSHDAAYPDDDWNLYSMLNVATSTCLNVVSSQHPLGVFKPFVLRLADTPFINSDVDAEIIVIARFIAPVHPRKIMIIGGGGGSSAENHPKRVKLFVNVENVDFTNISTNVASEEFFLPMNADGNFELIISKVHLFNNVVSLVLYMYENYSGDNDVSTYVKYIGVQGEHTHYRREAVQADYELFCTHQEISDTNNTSSVELHHH
jgi:hypothetical protein